MANGVGIRRRVLSRIEKKIYRLYHVLIECLFTFFGFICLGLHRLITLDRKPYTGFLLERHRFYSTPREETCNEQQNNMTMFPNHWVGKTSNESPR